MFTQKLNFAVVARIGEQWKVSREKRQSPYRADLGQKKGKQQTAVCLHKIAVVVDMKREFFEGQAVAR